MSCILLIGFEPFGGYGINSSWELLSSLPDAIGDFECIKLRLPVEFKAQKNLNIAYHLKADNVFTLRVEAWLWLFDSNFLEFTKAIADIFRETFDLESNYKLPYEMIDRQIGHDFGFGDYVD
jgi:hypothetical protein